jgi:DNA-binding MarR family transcriptional regulator
MEAAGYVRRENCESDRRGLYAVLTDQGWATMRHVAPHHVASVRAHFIDLIPPQSLTTYHAALAPVATHLRATR